MVFVSRNGEGGFVPAISQHLLDLNFHAFGAGNRREIFGVEAICVFTEAGVVREIA